MYCTLKVVIVCFFPQYINGAIIVNMRVCRDLNNRTPGFYFLFINTLQYQHIDGLLTTCVSSLPKS